MKSSLVMFAAEGSEGASEAGMSPEMFGVLALIVLVSLLLVTLAFRSVYTRH